MKKRMKPKHRKLLIAGVVLLIAVAATAASFLLLRETPQRSATRFFERLVEEDIVAAHEMLNGKAMNTSLETHFGKDARVRQFQLLRTELTKGRASFLYRTTGTPGQERDVALSLEPDDSGSWIITGLQVTPLIPESIRVLGAKYATLLCENKLPQSRELVSHLNAQDVANVERQFLDSAGPWKWALIAAEPMNVPASQKTARASRLLYDVTGGFVPFRFFVEVIHAFENGKPDIPVTRITHLGTAPRPPVR
jgi:hypothetical protein